MAVFEIVGPKVHSPERVASPAADHRVASPLTSRASTQPPAFVPESPLNALYQKVAYRDPGMRTFGRFSPSFEHYLKV